MHQFTKTRLKTHTNTRTYTHTHLFTASRAQKIVLYIEKKKKNTKHYNCNLIFDELSGVLWQKG